MQSSQDAQAPALPELASRNAASSGRSAPAQSTSPPVHPMPGASAPAVLPPSSVHGVSSVSSIPQESKFLSLPRELRDMVYDHLADHYDTPPASATIELHHYDATRPIIEEVGQFPSTSAPATGFVWSLLLACRQMHDEISAYMNRRTDLGAELDLAVDGARFWPTWTKLPILLARRSPIDVTIRVRLYNAAAIKLMHFWNQTILLQFIFEVLLPMSTPDVKSKSSLWIPHTIYRPVRDMLIRIEPKDQYTPDDLLWAIRDLEESCARRGVSHHKILYKSFSIQFLPDADPTTIIGACRSESDIQDLAQGKRRMVDPV